MTIRNLIYIFSFIVLASIFACSPDVTFNEPQPTDCLILPEFPKHIQGRYLNVDDSSMIAISGKLIIRYYNTHFSTHIDQPDSDTAISSGIQINIKIKEKNVITKKLDSLNIHIEVSDTLYNLNNENNIVKKFKGFYFLNICCGEDSWEVKKIHLSNGELTISSISSKLELENLKEITENLQDTVKPYRFKATRKQFKEFIKKGGFRDKETYVKQ